MMGIESASVLVINTGSSSVKFALFSHTAGESMKTLYRGEVEGIGSKPRVTLRDGNGITLKDEHIGGGSPGHRECFETITGLLAEILPEEGPHAIGHRVVHGGDGFTAPVVLDGDVLGRLASLDKLAPLHQPYNLMGIESLMSAYPEAMQVACFDTSFHLTQPLPARMFGLPFSYYESGVQRYGFHGLSYEYIAMKMREIAPEPAQGRVITAHLGAGASLCATAGGRSVATTMGFTALDGLPMGTRSGGIDPGVIFYLVREGMKIDEIEGLLLENSGLLGISGISSDMRELESSGEERARLAVDYFVYRAIRETGSLAAALGGADAIVFTGGIGENSAYVRGRICAGLGWLGVALDEEANTRNGTLISIPGSGTPVYVIPANEELVIAGHTINLIGG